MSRQFEEEMLHYIKYLDIQSPVRSDSHYMLRVLYEKYGSLNVHEWLDEYFKKETNKS